MVSSRERSSTPVLLPIVVLGLALALPAPVSAQYFGRNKVQYDDFDFRVLKTSHFDIHYYPEAATAVEDAARMSERWYERLARTFQHEFEQSKPIILYADHPDFQQTNTLSGFIGEGTGGVTESLKNRVIMPLTGSYWDTDHVLGHELVHAFQYNIAQSRRGGGLQGLSRLPLWMIEGMAEYLSVGREDPLTGMWLRDALLRDDLPTLKEMTRERRFFPYRFGQAFWTYVGGTYGDEAVTQLYRRGLRVGWEPAIAQILGIDSDSLSAEWHESIETEFRPLMADRSAPGEVGALLLSPATGAGRQNVSPAVSPDGRYVAFLSEKDLFAVDLFLADARTGEIVRKLTSAASDNHADALRFIDSSGSWSPDGKQFVYVIIADGDNEMVILDVDRARQVKHITVEERAGIGAISNPTWSPDGRTIVFSGQSGGISDLYSVDVETNEVTRLTNDKFADYQPTFSPDGRTVAFVSDRGPETDFTNLTYSRFRIAMLDLASGEVAVLPLFGNVKHMNPQFTPDGRSLYFISDQDGFSDVYRTDLASGEIYRVTRVATAVSGITAMSPAMSVASQTGTLVFSIFDEFEFHIYSLDTQEAGASQTLAARTEPAPARMVPPPVPVIPSRVSAYLDDPLTGLPTPGTYDPETAGDYDPGLHLDYVGQPSIGISTGDQYGNYIGGGAAAFFSDMLGDRSLGVAVQAQGTFKDIGAQVFYRNLKNRWNWGVGGGRIPYQLLRSGISVGPNNTRIYTTIRERIFIDSATGLLSYPFSTTRRVEGTLGFTRYSFDVEQEDFLLDSFGRVVDREVQDLPQFERDPLNLVDASMAFIGDNSNFGFTSPIRGERFHFEVQSTVGTADFQQLILDYRRYFNPTRNLTIGFRGLHFGRYGVDQDEEDSGFRQLFLGYETFIRGYAAESFESFECSTTGEGGASGCPEFNRLFGQQLGVANVEARVPLFGVEQLGLINFPYLPTELVAFADMGMAFDSNNPIDLRFDRVTTERVPVFAVGFSARVNLLGFLILESYYAYPFQRPEKGWHWGFNLAPGW